MASNILNLENLAEQTIGFLQAQNGGISRSYDLQRQINECSHAGIAAILAGRDEDAARLKKEMLSAWRGLGNVQVAKHTGWKFDFSAAQEIYEFLAVAACWPFVSGSSIAAIRMPKVSDIEPNDKESFGTQFLQPWLAGIQDAVSELSKMTSSLLLGSNLPLEKRLSMRQRYLLVAAELHSFLSAIQGAEHVSEQTRSTLVNSEYDRFAGKMRLVADAIERQQEKVADILDRLAAKTG